MALVQPSLADFERDYWAPDREAVLTKMRSQATPTPPSYNPPPNLPSASNTGVTGTGTTQRPPSTPSLADFERDYWAPDREQVLARMRQPAAPTGPTYGGDPFAALQQAAGALGINPQTARGRLGTIADYLNTHGMPGWGSAPNADDWLSYQGQGYDVLPAANNAWQWLSDPAGSQGGGYSGGFGGGQVFSDPATQEWEQLLRTLVGRLQQPQPMWTPAQLELQQTQLLQPLEQQHAAQRQQTLQQLANRGISPSSGIAQQALLDIDKQFNELRTQAQAGLSQQATQRQDQLFSGNEARALQGLSLMSQIPQLADTRLQLARQGIMDVNPLQLLGLQSGLQNQQFYQGAYNSAQQQQFWQALAQLIPQIFGG